MKGRGLKRFSSIIVILMLMLSQVLGVNAATYNLNITRKSQQKTNWCWVACAQMAGNYYSNQKSQKQICKAVKGKSVNETASLNEVASAIKFATKHEVNQGQVISFSEMKKELMKKRPVVIRVGWNSGGGHIYVVKGVTERGGSCPYDYDLLIDPWENVKNKMYPHINIVSGTRFDSGYGKYTHTFKIK